MTTRRTLARSTAVLGAATALTFAGAGVAMATTHDTEVDGDTVSVTFELEGGWLDNDTCGAVLTPTAAAPGIAARLSSGNLEDIFETLTNDDNVTVLHRNGLIIDTPFVVLTQLNSRQTVRAEELPPNVYSLVSVCLSDRTSPTINPIVMVGDPIEAISGSVETASSGGLDSASAMLSSEDTGDDDSGSLNGDSLGDLTGSDEE